MVFWSSSVLWGFFVVPVCGILFISMLRSCNFVPPYVLDFDSPRVMPSFSFNFSFVDFFFVGVHPWSVFFVSQRTSADLMQKQAARSELADERKERWRVLENLQVCFSVLELHQDAPLPTPFLPL